MAGLAEDRAGHGGAGGCAEVRARAGPRAWQGVAAAAAAAPRAALELERASVTQQLQNSAA